MYNRKNTKRALGLSFLSLLLCFSMLIGSTFAWFTDNVSVVNNKIQSGTLDIELYKVDFDSMLDVIGTRTNITDSKEPLFNHNNWEPGYIEFVNLEVRNVGTLASKWQASLIATSPVGKLAEVIEVYVADVSLAKGDISFIGTLDDRDLAFNGANTTYVGMLNELLANKTPIFNSGMELAAAGTFGIALKMQEDANNDYQNQTAGTFDILIQATQDTVEEDSFDDQYDKDAEYEAPADVWDGTVGTLSDDRVIDDAAEFAAFAASVTKNNTYEGETVKLNMSIDLDNQKWTSIASFAGTFDGDGHTISNLTGNLFGTVSGTVKNLNVDTVTVLNTTKNGANGFIGTVAAGGVIDNCNVSGVDIKWTAEVNAKDTTDGFGGVIGGVQAGATVQNCEFSDITVTSNGKTKRTGAVFSSITGTVKGCVFTNVNFVVADTDTLEGWVNSHGGGLACDVNGGAVVEDCVINNMQVNVYEAAGQLGGVFGKAHISGQTAPITLKDITVNGLTMNVGNASESMKNVAGFIGQPDSRKNDVRVAIDNCHINGLDMTLASSKQGESAAAGFISGLCGGVDVTNCSVSGKIDGTNTPANIGGFIGDAGWYGSIEQNFTNCSTNVSIAVKDSIAGGFIAVDGTLGNSSAILNFTNCQAKGTASVVAGGTGTANNFFGKTIE